MCTMRDTGVAAGWICHAASAVLRHLTASKDIDARGAEPAVGDIGGDHLVVAPRASAAVGSLPPPGPR
jgi:hypothetical protein